MRFSSIKYLLSEGFKNVWKNWMMSIASIGILVLCLLLTGSAALFSINISSALNSIESQNSTTIYLKEEIDTPQALQIGEQIKAIPNISNCQFFSKDEAVEKFKDELGSIFDGIKDKNPFPHAFHVTLNDISKYNETVEQIKQIDGVDSVVNRSELFEKLTRFDKLVSISGVFIVIILGLVSLFIISNTIRLTMYSRRFEISIMKSVGATDWFVRIPFIVEGIVIGIISAIISSVVLKFLYDILVGYIKRTIPFSHIPFSSVSFPIFLAFVAAGIGFGLIGGLISISKYLKKEGGEILGW